jgi:hypothetical protein
MRFTTVVELGGKTATGFPVPAEIVEGLGGGKKPAVTVTVGEYTYRSTIGTMGGRSMIPLSAEHRGAAGLAAGDSVEIDVSLDTAPRIVDVPADLAAALDGAGLRARFDALAFSHRKEHVRAIEEAKAAATRERRVAKCVEMLQK